MRMFEQDFEKISRKVKVYGEDPSKKTVQKVREVERTQARKGKAFVRYS